MKRRDPHQGWNLSTIRKYTSRRVRRFPLPEISKRRDQPELMLYSVPGASSNSSEWSRTRSSASSFERKEALVEDAAGEYSYEDWVGFGG